MGSTLSQTGILLVEWHETLRLILKMAGSSMCIIPCYLWDDVIYSQYHSLTWRLCFVFHQLPAAMVTEVVSTVVPRRRLPSFAAVMARTCWGKTGGHALVCGLILPSRLSWLMMCTITCPHCIQRWPPSSYNKTQRQPCCVRLAIKADGRFTFKLHNKATVMRIGSNALSAVASDWSRFTQCGLDYDHHVCCARGGPRGVCVVWARGWPTSNVTSVCTYQSCRYEWTGS